MEYPYYVIPDIEALSSAEGEERLRLVRRIAIIVGDPLALRDILGMDSEEFSQFYPDTSQPDLSTSDTIDTFLDRYGDPMAAESKEVKDVEEIVPLPPADYDLSEIESDPIMDSEDLALYGADNTSNLLNSFLSPGNDNAESKNSNNSDKSDNSDNSDSSNNSNKETPILSESLARAMIKNGNYSKALEIITDLSLNNPKKSIYFADQIRFLKKLILNQSKQTKQ